MSQLIFYTNPMSRGRIAHWMLEEIGQPYSTVWLEYGEAMRTPEFLAVNPLGKVPALQHGDVVVTEAAAICAYLADQFGDAGLIPLPGDPARAAFYRWLFFAAGPLEAAVTAKTLGWQVPEGKRSMVGFGSYDEAIDVLETALQPGPYVCGERFSAADVYLGAQLGWGMMFGTIPKRPVFEDYVGRTHSRPAAQRADRINEERINSTKRSA
ncbi:glutathione S-transferase family protein [Piscinibacter sakaiensis]|uniref:glutathione S-transferase family protein n=1 Tax=Piscinibacter sakaiensis TaxID=1547922 RepID=UPI003AAAA2D5